MGDDPLSRSWPGIPLLEGGLIYGGSAEIQRNIIARRLLDLGTEG